MTLSIRLLDAVAPVAAKPRIAPDPAIELESWMASAVNPLGPEAVGAEKVRVGAAPSAICGH